MKWIYLAPIMDQWPVLVNTAVGAGIQGRREICPPAKRKLPIDNLLFGSTEQNYLKLYCSRLSFSVLCVLSPLRWQSWGGGYASLSFESHFLYDRSTHQMSANRDGKVINSPYFDVQLRPPCTNGAFILRN